MTESVKSHRLDKNETFSSLKFMQLGYIAEFGFVVKAKNADLPLIMPLMAFRHVDVMSEPAHIMSAAQGNAPVLRALLFYQAINAADISTSGILQ